MLTKFDFSGISFDSSMSKFVLLVVLVLVVSFAINFLLAHSILGMSYRVFVAPGVIVHELAHAFLCLLTGASITKMAFFEKTGGHVEHKPSRIPILGSVLISLAPFFIGAIIIYFFSRRLGITGMNLTNPGVTQDSVLAFFRATFLSLDFKNPVNWLIIYLVLSIAVTMTPSAQDLRNTFSSVVFLLVVAFLIDRFAKFSILSLTVPVGVFTLLSTVLILLIFSLALSIVFFVISKFIKPI